MVTLVILFTTFIIFLLLSKRISGRFRYAFAGRIAMAAMLTFTAIGHFLFSKGMAMMVPPQIPFATEIIFITGIMEVAFAIGLLIPSLQVKTGWILIAFLVLILPSNIYAAIHHINLQKADYSGQGISYLWLRIPMQFFFIGWIYFSAIRHKPTKVAILAGHQTRQ